MSEGIHQTPPRNTDSKYYTVGLPSLPEKPRGFVVRDNHVWVFRSHESAKKYCDIYEIGLSIHNWDSITELAAQVQEAHNPVPLIRLEPEVDTGAEVQSVSVDDILEKGSKIKWHSKP